MKELLLISGWGFNRKVWDPLRAHLGEEVKESAYDLGMVRKAAPPQAQAAVPSVSLFAQGLQAVLAQHDRPCVAGWSMGGMVALEAFLDAPQLFSGLALISSTLKFCRDSDYPCGVPPAALRIMKRNIAKDPVSVLQSFLTNTLKPQSAGMDPNAVLDEQADWLEDGLDYLEHTDLRRAGLAGFGAVTVLHGTHDEIIPVDAGKYMAGHLGGIPYRTYAGMGHALPCVHAEKVAIDLKKLLNGCS